MQQLQIGRVYRHFKGDYYLVEALAKDSETGEACVIYRKLYGDGSLWVRPLEMFLSKVDREKYPDAEQQIRKGTGRLYSAFTKALTLKNKGGKAE